MMSNNTDQKDDHITIAINPAATTTTTAITTSTPSADTTPTIHSTKTLKSSLHPHPDNDSNTTESDPSSLTSLPALPAALHMNTSHAGVISNSAGRRHHQHRANSSGFQEVDMATLHGSSSNDFAAATTTESLSDPLTDASFFNTARRHSAPSSSGFVLESPTLDSTPYEFEMQRFNAYDGSSPSTVKVITTLVPKQSSANSTTTTRATTTLDQPKSANSFFTGWMAVPPSLAGRPKLSQDQEDYIRREYERGPVPLMWAKNDDIENQASTPAAAPAVAPVSTSWFGNWGFRSSTATTTTAAAAEAAANVAAPPRAAIAPISSDSGRREASQAL